MFRLGLKGEHKNKTGIEALFQSLRPETPNVPLIRCGADGDGGYLLPDDFEGIVACISPGVAGECSFDLDMAARGLDVYMADASVEGPPVPNDRFHFSKLFLDTYNSEDTIRIDDFCKRIGRSGDLILQMDIEGAEYRIINSMTDDLVGRFRIIVLELHLLDAIFTQFGYMEISAALRRLLRTHAVIHVHPNNAAPLITVGSISTPRIVELTLLRRDRAEFSTAPTMHPHPLDRPNVPNRPDVILPSLWHY